MHRIRGYRRSHGLTGGVLVLLALAAPLSSQEDAPASFGEVIDVRLINLEVVVTDRAGERVTGLGPEDFRLLVDGEEVPLAHFTEIRDGRVSPRPEPSSAAAGAPVERLESEQAVPTSYLVFLDDEYALDTMRDQVLDHLQAQLSHLRPEDRMAILRYDGDRVGVLADWTAPGPELAEAVRRAREEDGRGVLRMLEARGFDFNDPSFDAPDSLLDLRRGGPTHFQRNLRWQTRHRLGIEMLAAASSLAHFQDAPGRKVLVLLAGDWPPVGALSPYGRNLDGPAFHDSFDLFRPLVETANLLGWTVYPVAVSPRHDPGGSLEAGATGGDGIQLANASASHQARRARAGSSGASRRAAVDSTLRYLAAETGGRAVLHGDRTTALETIAQDTRYYYWLGFQPAFQGDDERHTLRIEVRGRGLSARTREGYIDLAPETVLLLDSQTGRIASRANR